MKYKLVIPDMIRKEDLKKFQEVVPQLFRHEDVEFDLQEPDYDHPKVTLFYGQELPEGWLVCPKPDWSGITEELMKDNQSPAYREACYLANSLYKKHYKNPTSSFELCDTTAGVISQIDNMVAELVKPESATNTVVVPETDSVSHKLRELPSTDFNIIGKYVKKGADVDVYSQTGELYKGDYTLQKFVDSDCFGQYHCYRYKQCADDYVPKPNSKPIIFKFHKAGVPKDQNSAEWASKWFDFEAYDKDQNRKTLKALITDDDKIEIAGENFNWSQCIEGDTFTSSVDNKTHVFGCVASGCVWERSTWYPRDTCQPTEETLLAIYKRQQENQLAKDLKTIEANKKLWNDQGQPWERLKLNVLILDKVTGEKGHLQRVDKVNVVYNNSGTHNHMEYRENCTLTDEAFLNLQDWLKPERSCETCGMPCGKTSQVYLSCTTDNFLMWQPKQQETR
jgi:hypothetical protein